MSAPTSHRGLSANSTSFGTVGAPSGNRTCEGGIASPATVIAHYGARRQAQAVLSQASFFSVNDLRLHFGLGRKRRRT